MNKVKFSDIATFVAGQSPESKYYSNNPNDGVPFLQGNRTFGMFFPTFDTYTSKVTKTANKGDILMSVRAPVGDLNFAPCDLCIGRGLSAINAKDGDNDFLFYALKYNIQNLIQKSSGTTFDSVNKDIVNDMDMIIPTDENIRKKASLMLKDIDSKINTNNRISFELESMAKTLYDYWFIQFEFSNEEGKPYKSSGGKMVYNEELKREIPEGWEVKQLKDFVILGNDRPFIGNDINTIDLSVMPSNSISLNELNNSSNFDTNLFEMKKGDILFGSIRPYLKKAGIAPCDGAFAGTIHCFRPQKEDYYNFALMTICSNNMFKYAINNSQGTKMPVVNSDRMLDYPIPYNENIIKKFNNTINIKDIICNNVMQNQELASLRDWLLPMLMNGQVTIKD